MYAAVFLFSNVAASGFQPIVTLTLYTQTLCFSKQIRNKRLECSLAQV